METTASRAAPPRRLARPGLKRPRTPTQLKEETNDHIAWQQQPLGAFDPSAAARHRTRGAGQEGEGASATRGAKDNDGSVGTGEGNGGRGHLRGPGRRRSAAASPLPRQRAAATAVLAATLLRATAAAAAAAAATSPLPADFRPAATALSSRLCSPAEDSRAYVTTIAAGGFGASGGSGSNGDKSGDRLLGARVLAQSLRSAGAKGDIVVLVPLERATGPTVDSLRRDGLTVQIVPKGLQSAGGEIVSEELMTKVSLWSLTSYDRVVFLDPRSLIQKNPDALFACEGFCAAGAVHSPSSSPSFRPGWAQEAGTAIGAAGQQQPPPLSLAHGLGGSGEDDDDDDEHDGAAAAAAAAAVLEKPLSVPPSWQPSTSVMVLEPSLAVHAAMLDKLTRTPAAGSLEAQVFLSSFLMGAGTDAGDRCTQFEDPVENAPSDRRRSRGGGLVAGQGGGGGWEDEEAGGAIFEGDGGFGGAGAGGGGSFLEDALMPVVLLNGPHVPRCSAGRKRTSEGVCQRLPYTFAAPSTDFQGGKNSWGGGAQKDDGVTPEPHIVHFADKDTPWKRLAYLHKPLFWKWNAYREQLECPYGNFFAPWVLFFIPCVVLAFARVYYKTASGGSGGRGRNRRTPCGGGGGAADLPQDGCSPSKSRIPWLRSTKQLPEHQQHQQQLAILPACGMAAAYDGAATAGAGCLEATAASRYRNSSSGGGGGGGGGVCIAVGADPSSSSPASCLAVGGGGGEQQLPVGVCYVLSALVGMYGLLWFRGARALAREVVDAGWHPVISVSVHDAWLCCALVVGLYVMDYLFFALLTRGRTLPKDSVAVAAVVFAARFLHSMAMDGEGRSSSGGGAAGGGVIWAGVVGAGVIALGFGHGSRAGVVHHLSDRAHFRCVAASCVVNTAISLAVCCAGPEAHHVATRRIQSAAVTAQMVFIALVYASVIGGARLRSDIDEAGSKISRTCSSASFVADALIGAAPGKGGSSTTVAAAPAQSPLLLAQERATEGRASGGVVGGGGGGAQRWSAISWIKKLAWHRRRVAAGIALLVLWKVSSANLRPASPARHFEKYGQSCLESQAGFVEAGGKRLSRVCGAEQALRPVATGAYFEAFRQDKVCLEVAGGGFLTLGRVHVAQACLPEFQFVFQEVASTKLSSKDKGDGSVGGGTAADSVEYCIYNPTSGFYLSAQGRPRAQCGAMEHWRVRPAPLAPGLKAGGGGGGGGSLAGSGGTSMKANSVFSALLHPNFLSRAPLLTFYGYLLAATALLVARALFSKLATSPCVVATGRGRSGSSGGGGGGGGGGHKHHRGLGARQRSRGRAHSRSHGSSFGGFVDTGYLGDPGYAGDAETGGEVTRGPSVSPVAAAGGQQRPEYMGWGVDVMDMDRRGSAGGSETGGMQARHPLKREASSSAGSAAPTCGGLLAKVLSGLVVACDAALLAGLWCLVPAHFAQAMSALTRDHHSAIDQGLGMDSNAAPADNIWSRSLGGVGSGGGGGGGGGGSAAKYTVLAGGGGEADSGAAAALSCDSGAWWLMSALVRWHLLFLLVAFCHLHGAVSASSSVATAQRWRNRRAGKKAKASAGAAEFRRRSPRSFWGLRSGERLAMRLRTAMGVLTLLLLSAVLLLPERSGLLFAGLHKHPGWARCAPAAGLDESWGVVSPLLVFAVLAATCGVYLRAGSSPAVRCLAAAALTGEDGDGGGLSTTAAAPRQRPAAAERESSGSTDGGDGGRRTVTSTGTSRGSGARHRMNEAARRMSPTRWVVGIRGRGRNGGRGLGESVARSAESNL
ncbi:unnamed protein product [Ectocarpus sp. 8 AP-2014]